MPSIRLPLTGFVVVVVDVPVDEVFVVELEFVFMLFSLSNIFSFANDEIAFIDVANTFRDVRKIFKIPNQLGAM